jgi:hypothetical protein
MNKISKSIRAGLFLVLAACATLPAAAAPVLQGTATSLTGINGLVVNGGTFDMTFVDGTCSSAFGACDVAHFNFNTQADANSAAQEILDAIAGTYFDTNVGTVGCDSSSDCLILIPYNLNFIFNGVNAGAINRYSDTDFVITNFPCCLNADLTTVGNTVYAVFNAATAVPEPLTLSIFGAGMLGAAAMRHRKKAKQVCGGLS